MRAYERRYTDCLARRQGKPRHLASGEPNFYLVGSQSYGPRAYVSTADGYAQLEGILDSL